MTVRVLLADDDELLRAGLRDLVESAPDMEAVGEATTGTQAVTLARRTRADVVLMDIRMPELDGLAATRLITQDEDLAGARVLILTTFEIDEYVYQALRFGASGFLGKGVEPDDLLDAIRVVHGGEALLSPAATKSLVARFLAQDSYQNPIRPERLDALTEREKEVLTMVAAGLPNDEIAIRLVVSPHTVKTHVNRTMTKLGAHDRAQLVVVAYETGLAQRGA
jgi:DNA-binding NarL/FixJ family response regulator